MNPLPRPEYPRPQFVRPDWLCLNGEWQFEIDQGDTGLERGVRDRDLADRIQVPFCPESALSGIANEDFLHAVWYRREIEIPVEWSGRRVLLHFQAVDYDATVWVNGREVGRHRGGFTPFFCDLGTITGKATLVVRARDDANSPQPHGKQSREYGRYSCLYTRTTGIWQTVWMEPVPESYLLRTRITPDVANGAFRLQQPLVTRAPGLTVRATLRDDAGDIETATTSAANDFQPSLHLSIPADRQRLWQPSDPHLYGLQIELLDADGTVMDRLVSYAGLRGVHIATMCTTTHRIPPISKKTTPTSPQERRSLTVARQVNPGRSSMRVSRFL